MVLSPVTRLKILETGFDGQVTTEEAESLISGVFYSGIFGMVIVFCASMFVKAAKPPPKEAKEILEIAEMF